MLDAFHANLYGGTGETASLSVALAVKDAVPRLMLAGGLNPQNVAERARSIQPWAVDVASGVEDGTPGLKDERKVRQFIAEVRGCGSMSEYFDIFDETFERVGTKRREDVHRDGDWHQVFHCWVIGRELDGETFVVLQKRTEDKDMYPGKIRHKRCRAFGSGRDGARWHPRIGRGIGLARPILKT